VSDEQKPSAKAQQQQTNRIAVEVTLGSVRHRGSLDPRSGLVYFYKASKKRATIESLHSGRITDCIEVKE
jgi:hypothetical protein